MTETALLSSFILVTLAELGDKTQLVTITLSSKGSRIQVFCGAISAFILMSVVGVILGGTLTNFLPLFWVNIFSGLIFVFYGFYSLLTNSDDTIGVETLSYPLLSTFSIVTLMELGDKTQLATIALSAKYTNLLPVFIGVITAFIIVTATAVLIGRSISKIIPYRYVNLSASILFIIFGVLTLSGVL